MVNLLHDEDANESALENKTVAIIGYGSQGTAQANMLKDSGVNVIVGETESFGGKPNPSWSKAKSDGFNVMTIDQAAAKGDIIHILLPDEVQAEVYEKQIEKQLKAGKSIGFSHGFNISFKKIVPPKNVNVIMVAPKAPGSEERKRYLEGFGVPGLVAVYQDATGDAKDIALAMAKAMRFTKAGVMECTFEQETYSDLFGEQCVLCGGLTELIKAGFETLVKAGYPPEMAYFECLHETKLIVDLIYEGGMSRMWHVVSNTAEYGGRTVGTKIIGKEVKEAMKKALARIESGEFANEWVNEYKTGSKNLNKLREEEKKSQLEVVGEEIRSLFKKK